ncbi:iron-siderophore ABC transporter substrate-binding protein [Vibrio fluvialis]|uniref:iron-siderophore ABC transporter substrate-binding protein n=1 Tax=Vibrio fluvialis TaxID=676 RepID=UPI001F2F78E8|nr:iron-siderophore ABC transporter substrate-binding protein [Vibrio fluvialis]EKO3387350.1 iron-siderophore ABC transporter substrate-binding protein [Vibrio fluvialis]ELV8697345.1 iron-siderophore ABC transporter substrate-binding protein [Vibrio fluvialis]MCE7622209.1 iron-siderophore ABC transporter substrate-binding protein [Vibrio fluvialis]HDM8040732.1 iron-siderophore ABC transporter substrate-binding protein [Vibrio fluvialis]
MCLKSTVKQTLLLFGLWVCGVSSALAAIEVSDSLGQQTLNAVPQRAAVLDWSLLEQVIELGVTPIAVTDADSYRDWVVKPAIPASAENVGTRGEPNLEKIAALKPDIILITGSQRDLKPRLEQIAPVLLYTNFSANDAQAEVAITQFKQLAQVFGQQALAEQKLAMMDQRFAELKAELNAHFGSPLPRTLVMRFADTKSTFIYTQDSMAFYVVEKLGLTPALVEAPQQWGIVQKPIADLRNVRDGYVLYIEPFNEEKKLKNSVLWKAMPFVRQQHVNSVESVWSYGGAMSLLYTAEAITASLLEMAPAS